MGIFKITALVALVAGGVSPAESQTQAACDKRVNVLNHLSRKYTEAPVALGIANNGNLVELLTTKDGETWTLLVTMPNGMTCLVAFGESWESITPQFGEEMAYTPIAYEPEKTCDRNPQYLKDFMEKNNPGAALVRELENRDAAEFIAMYNSFPPASDVPGDLVMLYISPTGASVYFVIFNEGCAMAQDQIPLLQFISMFPSVELFL